MIIYEVLSTWHKDGTVEAELNEIESDDIPQDTQKKGIKKDVYREYYLKKYDAQNYITEIVTKGLSVPAEPV